uniref:Uncharacterized protein n=1 Tax=Quercus lobata TaxID=97700 RepID=A0A7N2LTZ4_QUELO
MVANRQKPLKDSSGVLSISEDGNLVVLNGQEEILWSSNVSNSVTNSSATLLDSGNLVLQVDTTGIILWESFQHPSDSFLPRMKLSTNLRKDEKVQLTSWKSPFDPSIGSFSAGIDPLNIPEGFVWKDSRPYWQSGPWNGQVFIIIKNWNLVYHNGFSVVDDKQGTVYATFAYMDLLHLSKFVLDSQGNLMQTYWDDGKEDWKVVGLAPKDKCDVYGTCVANGSCDSLGSSIYSCIGRMSWRGNLVDLQQFLVGGSDIYICLAYLEFENERHLKVIITTTVIIRVIAIACTAFFLWSGYMSPEYAMQGLFSEKSDVFSFGILLLEIVSGRRSTSFCNDEQYLSLIGYAWKLWNDDNNMGSMLSNGNFEMHTCFAIDIIRSPQSLKDPEYIISNGSTFRLGFFSLVNSTNRYLGIWYNNISVFTVVWVANRQKPLKDSSGVLTIFEDGNLVLTPWKSPSDPSIGRFSSGIDQLNTPGAFIWKDGHPFWRTPWNGQAFIGIYNTNPQYHNGYTVVDDKEGTTFATFAYVNELPLSKFVLNSQGKLVQSCWNNRKEDWECDRVNNSGEEGKEDWFFKLKTMKVPDFAERSYGAKDDCQKRCLENCSCVAYVYDVGIGCLSWSGSLIDL